MSYCRWSSDDFRCDLYCYEDCSGGFTTHVSNCRYGGDIPTTPGWDDVDDPTWAQRMADAMNAQSEYLKTAPRIPIALPYAGETFNDATLEHFLARLITLKVVGYRVSEEVLDAVRAEIVWEITTLAWLCPACKQRENDDGTTGCRFCRFTGWRAEFNAQRQDRVNEAILRGSGISVLSSFGQ